jgi:ribosomal protein L7Ae-like RNA K-turn-binding protein
VTKRQFARSFKGEVLCGTPDELVAAVAARMVERIGGYLALANKAGKVVSGGESVIEALTKKSPGIVCVATDISPDIGGKVVALAARLGVAHFSLFDKDRLGALVGKGLRSSLVVEQGGFSDALRNEMEKYRNFFEGGTHAT